MGQSTVFSRHPGCEAAPKLLLGAPHRPHKQGQSQDTPAPQQLQADWLDTNREAPSRMWEGCSTLICWRSAAGGRRTGKDQTSNFPPRALQALHTTHEPSSSDNGWQLHSHHWLLQRPQLPRLLPVHSPDTLQLLCILLALTAHV